MDDPKVIINQDSHNKLLNISIINFVKNESNLVTNMTVKANESKTLETHIKKKNNIIEYDVVADNVIIKKEIINK